MITPEQVQYFEQAGFVVRHGASIRRYAASGLGVNQALTLTLGTKRDDPAYWTAVATSQGEDTALELVVSYNEHFTDPITAYVTAELRLWKRPS